MEEETERKSAVVPLLASGNAGGNPDGKHSSPPEKAELGKASVRRFNASYKLLQGVYPRQ